MLMDKSYNHYVKRKIASQLFLYAVINIALLLVLNSIATYGRLLSICVIMAGI